MFHCFGTKCEGNPWNFTWTHPPPKLCVLTIHLAHEKTSDTRVLLSWQTCFRWGNEQMYVHKDRSEDTKRNVMNLILFLYWSVCFLKTYNPEGTQTPRFGCCGCHGHSRLCWSLTIIKSECSGEEMCTLTRETAALALLTTAAANFSNTLCLRWK